MLNGVALQKADELSGSHTLGCWQLRELPLLAKFPFPSKAAKFQRSGEQAESFPHLASQSWRSYVGPPPQLQVPNAHLLVPQHRRDP
jgi:hypothetical protein